MGKLIIESDHNVLQLLRKRFHSWSRATLQAQRGFELFANIQTAKTERLAWISGFFFCFGSSLARKRDAVTLRTSPLLVEYAKADISNGLHTSNGTRERVGMNNSGSFLAVRCSLKNRTNSMWNFRTSKSKRDSSSNVELPGYRSHQAPRHHQYTNFTKTFLWLRSSPHVSTVLLLLL